MFDEDLSVFYDTDDFGCECTRTRGQEAPVTFAAILSVADEEALQGYVVSAVRELRYVTAAVTLLEGDVVAIGADTWRVLREGRRVNDGAESVALLTLTTA